MDELDRIFTVDVRCSIAPKCERELHCYLCYTNLGLAWKRPAFDGKNLSLEETPPRMLRQGCSDDEDSDGETLYTETESEESDEETQSDIDFIDDSELSLPPPTPIYTILPYMYSTNLSDSIEKSDIK
jgi:hypothetical protein